jgi:hypothetical protein
MKAPTTTHSRDAFGIEGPLRDLFSLAYSNPFHKNVSATGYRRSVSRRAVQPSKLKFDLQRSIPCAVYRSQSRAASVPFVSMPMPLSISASTGTVRMCATHFPRAMFASPCRPWSRYRYRCIRPRAGLLRLRGPPTLHQHAHAACVRPDPIGKPAINFFDLYELVQAQKGTKVGENSRKAQS